MSQKKEIARIKIDTNTAYDNYCKYNKVGQELSNESLLINKIIIDANINILTAKRRRRILQAKHNALSEYGTLAYNMPPPILFHQEIISDPALSRVKKFSDFRIKSFPLDRLTKIKNSKNLKDRLTEEENIKKIVYETYEKFSFL